MSAELNTELGPAINSPYRPVLLADLFDADTERGILIWKSRPVELFSSKNAFAAWNARYAGVVALASVDSHGYHAGAIFCRLARAHRVLFAMYHGHWPVAHIDHLNGIRSDNRAENLRDVSQSENNKNATIRADNASGVTGVMWHNRRQKWQAQIRSSGKTTHIGYFTDLAEATAVRKAAELEHGYHENHGRHAGGLPCDRVA